MHDHFLLGDWERLLKGQNGWPFLLQVAGRAALTYVVLMFAMRVLGKRVEAELTIFELSIVIMLAAAVGVPLQISSKDMVPGFTVLTLAVLIRRWVARASAKKKRVESLVTGRINVLIEEGPH